jgi:peptide/nickel transport system substrate-binding protein
LKSRQSGVKFRFTGVGQFAHSLVTDSPITTESIQMTSEPKGDDGMSRIHPAILDATTSLRNGKINRRQFLRFATLLGASIPTAYALAGCAAPTTAPATTPAAATESGAAAEAAATGAIKRGGTWTSAMQLQRVDHPARLSWIQGGNVVRQVCEYLTEVGPDNLTYPHLLDRWEASDDVKTWTLHLRQGVTFNNGDELTADDVLFTFGEWLNPDVGSSMLGFLGYLGGIQNVEKVDDYTITLHLQSPSISVPEDLNQYPAVILHRNFEGDFIQQPIGTGPFTLVEYAEGERAIFQARTDYWRMGEDGNPLPYLDTLTYVSLDHDSAVAAMLSGQVDSMYNPTAADWEALKDQPGLSVYDVSTAQCLVGRMRVDIEPWDDVRVRNALKLCQDRARIMELSYKGQGDLSIDAHVAPIHPEYAERPIPDYDPDAARALLEEYAAEKGIELPLRVTLSTKNDEGEPEIAQALREMASPAGFDIELDITDPNGYWDRWTEVPLGITAWTHRPLGTMVLAAGYSVDENGAPVPWNETRWADPEFNEKLTIAQSTLDIEERRAIMGELEDIFIERGPIFNSYWKRIWNITRSEFKNVVAHPTNYDLRVNEGRR